MNIQELSKDGRPVRLALNSDDTVFAEVRDLNFLRVGGRLGGKARYIQEVEESTKALRSGGNVSQLTDLMQKLAGALPEKTMLAVHINIAEMLKKQRMDKVRRFPDGRI